jgi:hypothetical protein
VQSTSASFGGFALIIPILPGKAAHRQIEAGARAHRHDTRVTPTEAGNRVGMCTLGHLTDVSK